MYEFSVALMSALAVEKQTTKNNKNKQQQQQQQQQQKRQFKGPLLRRLNFLCA